MKKNIFIIAVALIAFTGCRNQDQNLNADVEIPVSVEDIKLKPIEEFINTTGTAFPKGEILLKSKITASYTLKKILRQADRGSWAIKYKPGRLLHGSKIRNM